MKSIFIYSYNLELGGVERSLIGLLRVLDPAEYKVDLFLAKHEGELMGEIPEHINLLPTEKKYNAFGIPIKDAVKQGYISEMFYRITAKLANKLMRFVKRDHSISLEGFMYHKAIIRAMKPQTKKYDVAISFAVPYYYVLTKVDADKKIGFVHTDYSVVHIKSGITRKMFADIDVIAAVSGSVRQALINSNGVDEKKTIVVENIISPAQVKKLAEEPQSDMLYDGSIRLLSVGRFCEAKNFDNVPYICKMIAEKGIDIKWYLIGFGAHERLIKQRINETDMKDRVIILGKKDNPYPYMANCDLYVQPSRFEGKAVTVREAQILGKPVVITDYATAKSQLEDGVDGIIVPLDNKGCAGAIAALLNDREKMNRISAVASSRDYSNKTEIERILK